MEGGLIKLTNNIIVLKPITISTEILKELDKKGLIKLFHPTFNTLNVPVGENIGESLYESNEQYGPHKLIAVGVNKQNVRLGFHPDNEDFLIPNHGSEVKPVYLLICHLQKDELIEKDVEGTISAVDFTCLSLYPAPRGAEMLTMLKGTLHCELTTLGDGDIGCFYVTEPRDITIDWVDLNHVIVVE